MRGGELHAVYRHRAALRKPYLYQNDDSVIAIACDTQPPEGITIPVLDINDIGAIARFIYDDFYSSR